jgi:L-rhamnose mutarotase
LLIAKNRLQLGIFIGDKCESDNEVSKINGLFDTVQFDIEKDWNILINSRVTARNIIDKLNPDEKLESDDISKIYWLGPNKNDDHQEDIVLELNDGSQYSFYLNKNLSSQKSSSFNNFAEELIGQNLDKIFKEEYLPKWNKLTQEWITTIYENSNKEIQRHIEKFIDPKRIETIQYFDYFDIKHSDPKFKHLGEFISDVDKNILKFSDLLNEVWKNKDKFFSNSDEVKKKWSETKTVILNSKILENLFTSSLKTQFPDDIVKGDDNFKTAGGTVKMKLFKILVDKMQCLERPVYYLSNNGNNFNLIPSRDFFRKNYDDMILKFDYHVDFEEIDKEDDDFKVNLKLDFGDKNLLNMFISIGFSGGEMSGKLNSKYKFELSDDFNYTISKN